MTAFQKRYNKDGGADEQPNEKHQALRIGFGGDPESELDVCPGDGSCQYQELNCNETLTYHTADCYTEVERTVHSGGLNAHVCKEGTSFTAEETHTHNSTCYSICYGMISPCMIYHADDCPNKGKTTKTSSCKSSCYIASGVGNTTVYKHTSGCVNTGMRKIDSNCSGCYKLNGVSAYKCGTCGEIYKSVSGTCTKSRLTCDKTTNTVSSGACIIPCRGRVSVTYHPATEPTYHDEYPPCTTWHNDTTGDGIPDHCDGSCNEPVRVKDSDGTPAYYSWTCSNGHSGTGNVSACTHKKTNCNHELNTHVCTSACKTETVKVQGCDNPHHVEEGTDLSQIDSDSAEYHYNYGDARCWKACGDNSKHKNVAEVKLGDGSTVSTSDIFINLDREFWIYVPDTGDFAQSPSMHGILDTTSVRGMGYYDGMDADYVTVLAHIYI